jgi:diketogulonate reductase-like aldo/keto reductase
MPQGRCARLGCALNRSLRPSSSGKCKTIGVSNYSIKTLTELLKTAKVVPAVNSVRLASADT